VARADRTAGRRAALGGIGVLALSGSFSLLAREQGGSEALARIDDLRALAAQVKKDQQPLLLFFSTPGCPYCAQVRRNYLAPRVRDGARSGVAIREVEITASRSFVGLDGKRISESTFAAGYGIRMVPVVLLVDAAMKPLAEPLVGIGAADFYESFLVEAIETASRRLRGK
jgi:thioredoxin-related protein